MTFKTPLACRAAFAMAAALSFALPVAAQDNPRRVPNPVQEQQFRQLEADNAGLNEPYIKLQRRFDTGELTAQQYRDDIAALDAALSQTGLAAYSPLPDTLMPHVTGCTADGYSVDIPVSVGVRMRTADAKDRTKNPAALMRLADTIERTFQKTRQDAALNLIPKTTKIDISAPAFQSALQEKFRRIATSLNAGGADNVRIEMSQAVVSDISDCGSAITIPAP